MSKVPWSERWSDEYNKQNPFWPGVFGDIAQLVGAAIILIITAAIVLAITH